MIFALLICAIGGFVACLAAWPLVRRIRWSFAANSLLLGVGVFLFNAILYAITMFAYFNITRALMMYAPLAVILSIIGWVAVAECWHGSKTERYKLALIGSSFYWLLTGYVLFRRITLQPSYPGDDLFMAALALDLAIVITGTAALSCTLILGWPRTRNS